MKSAGTLVNTFILPLLLTSAVLAGVMDTQGKLKVFVSILPQKYFVERIAGKRVDVKVLVGPGHSPHTYEPTPHQLAELSEARLFFRIGVPFEKILMPKIRSMFKHLIVVDTSMGIKLRGMASAGESHDAGDRHDHLAGTPDPHIWLDPVRVKTMAQTICDSLSKVDPAGAALYQRNLKRFREDLDRLNNMIRKALAPVRGKQIFVFHPSYGYFAERYGLKQVAVETGGKEPTARQLTRLIDRAKRSGVKVIFVQPQFDAKYAETIAGAIGGAVVSLDPLAPDYIDNLEDMAAKVESALSGKNR